MSSHPTFIDRAVRGEVLPDEIDDFIDYWHDADSDEALHEFLGLSFDEYSLFVAHPDNISTIITARLRHQPILEAVNDNLRHDERIAARADDAGKLAAIKRWIAAQPDR